MDDGFGELLTELDSAPSSQEQSRAAQVSAELARIEEREQEEVKKKFERLGIKYGVGSLTVDSEPPAPLLQLNEGHLLILSMYMSGESLYKISKTLDVSRSKVNRVLNSKPAQDILIQWRTGVAQELEALLPKAIDVTRQAMDDSDPEIALKGVDRFQKIYAMEQEKDRPDIQINITETRARFLSSLKEVAESMKVIDVTATEVKDD